MFNFLKSFYFWAIAIFVIFACAISASYLADFSRPMNWGVTFSWPYAQNELGLDPQETYLAILDDLGIDRIRLSAYWNEIESVKGKYDFTNLDWQMNEASKRNVKIVLAIGRRLPRWPECHDPEWLKDNNSIDSDERQLKFVETVINRYKTYGNILYWQVENEPYLSTFGICPPLNAGLFKDEIALVRKFDDRQILVTDSGELSTWWPISHSGGDVLGTTLYRVVYNPTVGYFKWFTPPSFYWARVELLKKLTPIKRVIVAELQAESWHTADKTLAELTQADHNKSMSISQFKNNILFTRRAGFDEAYLWGAEWWYLMKKEKGNSDYWEEAKKLWGKGN